MNRVAIAVISPVAAGFCCFFTSCPQTPPQWLAMGPSNVQNMDDNVANGGRIDDIKISYDYNGKGGSAMFLACPGGGVWRSTNFMSANPDWEPLTDHIKNVPVSTVGINVITSISVDPNNNRRILASPSQTTFGLLESTDGGDTWALTNLGDFASSTAINRVLIDPSGAVWVACDNALYVREKANTVFTKIDNPAFVSCMFDDVVFFRPEKDKASVYVGVVDRKKTNLFHRNQSGIWKVEAVNGNFTCTKMAINLQNIYGGAISSTLINVIKLYADFVPGVVASISQPFDSFFADPTGSIWGLLNVYQLEGNSWQPKWQLSQGQVGSDVQAG
jgi:hypothetical protein